MASPRSGPEDSPANISPADDRDFDLRSGANGSMKVEENTSPGVSYADTNGFLRFAIGGFPRNHLHARS